MPRAITYVNTDLDLTSAADLTGLVAAFESGGVFALHVTRGDDGFWFATLETDEQHDEPEPNIAAMAAVAEGFAGDARAAWAACARRELNIGYDCGTHPWAFNQALSPALLARIAALGISLRITLYPEEERAGAVVDEVVRPTGPEHRR